MQSIVEFSRTTILATVIMMDCRVACTEAVCEGRIFISLYNAQSVCQCVLASSATSPWVVERCT